MIITISGQLQCTITKEKLHRAVKNINSQKPNSPLAKNQINKSGSNNKKKITKIKKSVRV